jgi:hypothetical protein
MVEYIIKIMDSIVTRPGLSIYSSGFECGITGIQIWEAHDELVSSSQSIFDGE